MKRVLLDNLEALHKNGLSKIIFTRNIITTKMGQKYVMRSLPLYHTIYLQEFGLLPLSPQLPFGSPAPDFLLPCISWSHLHLCKIALKFDCSGLIVFWTDVTCISHSVYIGASGKIVENRFSISAFTS